MEPTTPPNPMPEHELGYEILTKHKEAIRQLRFLANWGPSELAKLKEELSLDCSEYTIERRLNEEGYHRCVACQKPFLTKIQAAQRWLYGLNHIFWTIQWLSILFSDECTFLIGDHESKARVTRKHGERTCSTCIQHQFHRGHTTPVNCWGAIGHNYKSELIIIQGHGKRGSFVQTDYLEQVLEPVIEVILEDFGVVTAEIGYLPTFMEDGNPAHGHKSITNPCAIFREKHGIQLLNHPSTSPDLNPIEKCWRAMKQSLHRRKIQPTNEIDIANAMIEEWNALDQEWINGLIANQGHWIWEVVARRGWMTAN
ncbi:hypothetical protein B7463_g9491, partial [Scytalidium lignicola]